MEKHLNFLKSLVFFQDFTEREISILLSFLNERKYRIGQVICSEGEVGASCFIVESGTVKVSTNKGGVEQILAVLGRGEMFGQVSLIDGGKRSATCTAGPKAILLKMERTDFKRLFDASSLLAFKFLSQITISLATNLREADLRFSALVDKFSEAVAEVAGHTTSFSLDRVHVVRRASDGYGGRGV